MLASIRRSHNLVGLGYSSYMNTVHKASTSKHHVHNHFMKQHHRNKYHYAPNKHHNMLHRTNHVDFNYKSVGMTVARYERLNSQSDYTVIHGIHNGYRRFKYGVTIQSKDFKAMWVPKSKPIRLKAIWVSKTSP